MRNTASSQFPRTQARDIPLIQPDATAVWHSESGHNLSELPLPVARDTSDAKNLTNIEVEADVLECRKTTAIEGRDVFQDEPLPRRAFSVVRLTARKFEIVAARGGLRLWSGGGVGS